MTLPYLARAAGDGIEGLVVRGRQVARVRAQRVFPLGWPIEDRYRVFPPDQGLIDDLAARGFEVGDTLPARAGQEGLRWRDGGAAVTADAARDRRGQRRRTMPRTYSAEPVLALRLAPALWWKRPFDLVLGAIALLVALPLIACLALAVVLDSPGHAFLRQERVGREGRRFRMWKLRTMHAGCDQAVHRRTAADWFAGRAPDHHYKSLTDPRITRVGRLLRRTDLDELPQLLNVLLGDMSLVGPRPAIPYELAHYRSAYFRRLSVPPGMTGLWQVTRRDRLPADEMMRLDLRYVEETSPWLDLKVLAMTALALLGPAARGD